jgi:glycosyltransferase involved in cell wall biosynthesis
LPSRSHRSTRFGDPHATPAQGLDCHSNLQSRAVVIPTYNRARLLPAALDSVFAQTYGDWEIVVVDDGSKDDTEDVVRRYGERIRYIRQENRGVGAARNVGIENAHGEFIAFLDSDDFWYDFKLALQVALFEQRPQLNFLFTEFIVLKDDGSTRPNGSRLWFGDDDAFTRLFSDAFQLESSSVGAGLPSQAMTVYVGRIYRALIGGLPALTSSVMVRRSAMTPTTRFAERVAIFEDWEFFARLARSGESAFADIVTTVNRGHAGPERVTACSRLVRAQCFVSLLNRVWKADPSFLEAHGDELRRVEATGLLAVAREGVLASQPDVARGALDAWRALAAPDGSARARFYGLCARLPAGALLLRVALAAERRARHLTGRSLHGSSAVNPAA